MGLRGPLPNLRVVNSGFRPEKTIPRPKPALPKCPAWLSKEAKTEWRRVAGPLYRLALLTDLDRQTLAMYCQTWARYLSCQKILAELGDTYIKDNGEPKQRPEYYILQACSKELRAFITLFGLSPSSRMRMQLPNNPSEEDELEALLDE